MAAMLALAIFGRGLVALLPMPVLAAIVVASLTHALSPAPLVRLWRLRRDNYVATAAVLAVLLLGVLNGMLFAVACSVLALLQRLARADVTELARLPGSTDFASRARHPDAEAHPGLLVLRPGEPVFFANAERIFNAAVSRAEASATVTHVILSLEETPDLDSTALDALAECAAALEKAGQRLLLARVKDHVRDSIAQVVPELATPGRCFHSVIDAYNAAVSDPA
jgi:MFS superfamily sulfate permease-like transporter